MPETSTFRSLLIASGLNTECADPHLYTLFVPTNDAWDAVPPAALLQLKQLAHRPALTKLLLNHMYPGMLSGASLAKLPKIHTAADSVLLTPVVAPEVPTAGQAVIIRPNIVASNGLIHLTKSLLVEIPSEVLASSTVEK